MSLTCKPACPASLVWIPDLEKTSGAWAGKSACGISGKRGDGLLHASVPVTLIGAKPSDSRAALPLPACHKGVYARLRRAMERSEFALLAQIPGEGASPR